MGGSAISLTPNKVGQAIRGVVIEGTNSYPKVAQTVSALQQELTNGSVIFRLRQQETQSGIAIIENLVGNKSAASLFAGDVLGDCRRITRVIETLRRRHCGRLSSGLL